MQGCFLLAGVARPKIEQGIRKLTGRARLRCHSKGA